MYERDKPVIKSILKALDYKIIITTNNQEITTSLKMRMKTQEMKE